MRIFNELIHSNHTSHIKSDILHKWKRWNWTTIRETFNSKQVSAESNTCSRSHVIMKPPLASHLANKRIPHTDSSQKDDKIIIDCRTVWAAPMEPSFESSEAASEVLPSRNSSATRLSRNTEGISTPCGCTELCASTGPASCSLIPTGAVSPGLQLMHLCMGGGTEKTSVKSKGFTAWLPCPVSCTVQEPVSRRLTVAFGDGGEVVCVLGSGRNWIVMWFFFGGGLK